MPAEWKGVPEEKCATFSRTPPLGALQISSARKEAEPVTDQDLLEFAVNRLPREAPIHPVRLGPFIGFSKNYVKDNSYWREWWLRCDRLMVYVTYNVAKEYKAVEDLDIDLILDSLRPTTESRQ